MYEKSLLLNEVFNPYLDNIEEVREIVHTVYKSNKYTSVETDIIFDNALRKEFHDLSKKANWSVTKWIINELTSTGLSASTTDKVLYNKTLKRIDELIKLALEGNAEFLGVGSGPLSQVNDIERGMDQFENTLYYIYKKIKHTDMKIVIEPLDQFAHKKFLIGDVDRLEKFLGRFDDSDLFKEGKLGICYDTAHFALNEADLEDSVQRLSKYISKIHLSNAVTDKNSELYGDHHMPLGSPGFMNLENGKKTLKIIESYTDTNKKISVAAEVRTHKKEDAWNNENIVSEFISALV